MKTFHSKLDIYMFAGGRFEFLKKKPAHPATLLDKVLEECGLLKSQPVFKKYIRFYNYGHVQIIS